MSSDAVARQSPGSERVPDALQAFAVDTDEHLNAPAVVVRADEVAAALETARAELGYDHCACVTAQADEDRFETIYHLRRYDDPTDELSVVVPTAPEDPASETAAGVYRTAEWHEREAYDLVGIEYDGHPDLRRILLPETWQGHPLRPDYDREQPQLVPYREHERQVGAAGADGSGVAGVSAGTGVAGVSAGTDGAGVSAGTDGADGSAGTDGADSSDGTDGADSSDGTDGTNPTAGSADDFLYVNVGPHHPATHGVLHLGVTLDGEAVVDVEPDIGYIHRCEEQMCQQGTYRHQIMPYPDRWDWGGAGLCSEWAYARAAEDLAGIEVPEYAQVIRTMCAELSRMLSHFLAFGTYALDVVGDFNVIWQYAVRDRELIQDALEAITGQRLMFNYLRLGGVAWDLPEPRAELFDDVRTFVDGLPPKLSEYHDLLTNNEIFQARTVETGVLPPEAARDYGCTGPVARASGVDYDLRRDDPYGYYPELDWDVVTDDGCDNFARLVVRIREIEESARIVAQCVDLLEGWPEDEREIQSNVPRTLKPAAGTETYRAVEGAKGELGIYIRSDGTQTPARFKIRGPSFSNLQALPTLAEGGLVPDLIASLGSLDTIMGEVDR